MKILVSAASDYFTDYKPISEGIISYELIKHLSLLGHQIHAISPVVDIRKKLPGRVVMYPMNSYDIFSRNIFKIEAGRFRFALQAYLLSRKILDRNKIDIVHHILPSDYMNFFDLVPSLKRPFVVGPAFLPWKLPVGESMLFESAPARIFRRLGGSSAMRRMKRELFFRTMDKCDSLLVTSRKLYRYYAGLVSRKKISLVPIGVDTARFRPGLGMSKKRVLIFSAGVVHAKKGFEYLIRALPEVNARLDCDVELVIAGYGPQENYLQQLARGLGVRVKFLGFISRDSMIKHYRACSLFCLPSLNEPFGMVVLEAMACGKPVVATNAGGIPEIVAHGRNGLLVPPRNPKALAEAIAGLLSDGGKLARFGRSSRKMAERYDWKIIAGKISRIYEKLL